MYLLMISQTAYNAIQVENSNARFTIIENLPSTCSLTKSFSVTVFWYLVLARSHHITLDIDQNWHAGLAQ